MPLRVRRERVAVRGHLQAAKFTAALRSSCWSRRGVVDRPAGVPDLAPVAGPSPSPSGQEEAADGAPAARPRPQLLTQDAASRVHPRGPGDDRMRSAVPSLRPCAHFLSTGAFQ
ncbi:unnamed protein product [Callosobruchus maculatus]|uniref:Uncharacterized protein n=1 Tax=Callosobruchus maculatus TaxID=64391 RepID=A0A653DXS3_CALMS|nr:unnamed protein product [Callosobruchus maculatus]